MQINNFVTFSDGRVFIDIAKGCGNACDYCYSEDANELQVVFAENLLLDKVDTIINDSRFIKGKKGTLISFCPHTEPFKTNSSTTALFSIIKKIQIYGNRMQISTKEIIPDYFIDDIKQLGLQGGQLTVFVSISSIKNWRVHEPFASEIFDRFDNFKKLKAANIYGCLYIKPFLVESDSFDDLDLLIKEYTPDVICVGIMYEKNSKGEYRHPTDLTVTSDGMNCNMRLFCHTYKAKTPLFYTSSCVIAFLNEIENSVIIPEYLCADCSCRCKESGKWQN